MAKTRETHVFRAAKRDDEDIWVDIERVDKFYSVDRTGRPEYQKKTRNMYWGDNEYEDPYEHPTRTMREVEVKHPEDTEIRIPVLVIDKMVTRSGQGQIFLKATKIYVNDIERNQIRQYVARRVFHWDTETDPRDDPGAEYIRVEGTEDRSQYVDVALLERITTRSGQGIKFKQKTYIYNIEHLKEFSEPTPEDEIDLEKITFLDPWQNIINVNWSRPLLMLVGQDANGWHSEYSVNGTKWVNNTPQGNFQNYARLNAVAYGNGIWVAVGTLVQTEAQVMVSRNAIDWETGPLFDGQSYWGAPCRFLVFGKPYADEPGVFVMVKDFAEIFTSEDGLRWTSRAVLAEGTYGRGDITCLAYLGADSSGIGGYFIAATEAEFETISSGGSFITVHEARIVRSANGLSWGGGDGVLNRDEELDQSTHGVHGLAQGERNNQVSLGWGWTISGGFLSHIWAWSGPGANLGQTQFAPGGIPGGWQGLQSNLMAYGSGCFVACFTQAPRTDWSSYSDFGLLGRSTTGTGWSNVLDLQQDGNFLGIFYSPIKDPVSGDGSFIAHGGRNIGVSDEGGIAYASTDGTNWTPLNISFDGGYVVSGVAGKRGVGEYVER